MIMKKSYLFIFRSSLFCLLLLDIQFLYKMQLVGLKMMNFKNDG